MNANHLNRTTLLLALLVLLLGIGGTVLWPGLTSAQMNRLPASHDAFIDLNNPQTSYDGQRLEVTYSHFLADFKPTRRSLLQFDLSGVTAELEQARLVVEVVENNLPPEASLDLALYGVVDGWEKSALTFDSRPQEDVLLETVSVAGGYIGPVRFGENTPSLGRYLAQERQGDGLVSFELRFENGAGALGFAGNVLFEDSEGSADGVNGNEPFLELKAPELDTSGWQRLFLPIVTRDTP